jgi:hypothetical protein
VSFLLLRFLWTSKENEEKETSGALENYINVYAVDGKSTSTNDKRTYRRYLATIKKILSFAQVLGT